MLMTFTQVKEKLVSEGWSEVLENSEVVAVKTTISDKLTAVVSEGCRGYISLKFRENGRLVYYTEILAASNWLSEIKGCVGYFETYFYSDDSVKIADAHEKTEGDCLCDKDGNLVNIPADMVAAVLIKRVEKMGKLYSFMDLYETLELEDFGINNIVPTVEQLTVNGRLDVVKAMIDRIAELHAVDVIKSGYSDNKYDIKILDEFFKQTETPECVGLAWADLKNRLSEADRCPCRCSSAENGVLEKEDV